MTESPPRTAVVVGAGTMGAGIAQLAASSGWTIRLVDVNTEVLSKSVAGIRASVSRLVERGKLDAPAGAAIVSRLHAQASFDAVGDAELAIEAVIEDLTIKQSVFNELARRLPGSAILATNTSSLPVSRIAAAVPSPERVVGMHFFNPATLMPLVEVIRGERSSPEAAERAVAVARSWGKTTVLAKDTPGFIVNRVARGYYLEALRLLDEGIGGVDEIDGIMRSLCGFKMGPFELMDLVGLDVNLAVSTSVWEQMNRPPRLTPHPIQQKLVQQGRLGRKSGRGFYDHGSDVPLPAYAVNRRSFTLNPMLAETCRVFVERAAGARSGTTEQLVVSRILGAIFNEAGLALHDGVASESDIDLAMVKGTNYPRGPLAWAAEIGYRNVRGLLRALSDSTPDDRYAPAPVYSSAE